MEKYKAKYRDKLGSEISEFKTNGSELEIELRGIKFNGNCFETLEGNVDKEKFEYFEYGNNEKGDLINCQFNLEIPVKIVKNKNVSKKLLQVEVQLDKTKDYGITLHLDSEGNPLLSSKKFEYFEDALIDIQNQLPKNEKIKCCLSCRFSHYHPVGNGMFGHLSCFKGIKEAAKKVESKNNLFQLFELADKENNRIQVQETYLCEEHEFITNKDWNYSNWK